MNKQGNNIFSLLDESDYCTSEEELVDSSQRNEKI